MILEDLTLIQVIKAYNMGGTWTLSIVMVYNFLLAWSNGMEALLKINTLGEASIEAVMIVLWLISIVVLTIKRFMEDE